ncbi:hypothetical protein A2966_03440 [Candidatus Roizmanbacteria bacterium RIFCSPLOWO2_01_FULL_41_22]|nr:MAG: hypothetical protein A2966_03440 [Candidatus Roizmanbacteria bacterium RIFCSPLOWO2_01_FULL_41_22]OGK58395.1 MAG: hypothetical protein A3H86_02505 [Candidatus Roizmanbacteria bacterium RIFCSPLOWO2_02_FULL_41_9]
MRTLVISDTHLGLSIDEYKYRFLETVIRQSDRVIINGDFWEGFLYGFNQFLDSPWKRLFPLLKKRHTIYIYGNHDRPELMDERTKLFSDLQTHRHKERLNGKSLVFEHGHNYVSFSQKVDGIRLPKLVNYLNLIEKVLVRKINFKYAKMFLSRYNREIKIKTKPFLIENEIFVCGHTHCSETDFRNNFINTGFIKHGLAQYLIIEDHTLTSHEEWYS